MLRRCQLVPHTAHSLQPSRGLGILVQLPPEISDMDLNGPFIGFADVRIIAIFLAPDYANQVSLRANSPAHTQKLLKEIELTSGQG